MATSRPWTLYLGTHEVSWLTREIGPLFVRCISPRHPIAPRRVLRIERVASVKVV
jgi:hypothetical protein